MVERTFTIVKSEVDVTGGKFVGKSPYNVAAKAARSIFKEAGKTRKREIRFSIQEVTRDSTGKVFNYIGVKESFDTPLIVKRGDTEVEIKHKYHVKSCRV